MSSWTPGELDRIGRTDELDLASERRDGSLRDPVTMWVVRDRDDLYVRSMHGPAGAWFRGTQTRRQGHIRSGGVDKDVSFVIDTDPELNDRIDAAYRNKYRRYGTASSAVSSTLRHETQRSSSYRANYRAGALASLRRKVCGSDQVIASDRVRTRGSDAEANQRIEMQTSSPTTSTPLQTGSTGRS